MINTRQHPTARFRTGDKVWVEFPLELCAVISDTHGMHATSYAQEEHEQQALTHPA